MARIAFRPVNLLRLRDKMFPEPEHWQGFFVGEVKTEAELLERIQRDRLRMTDWAFRQRYSRWL
jgi:hypothetical protein